jgi:hypothetical protein
MNPFLPWEKTYKGWLCAICIGFSVSVLQCSRFMLTRIDQKSFETCQILIKGLEEQVERRQSK